MRNLLRYEHVIDDLRGRVDNVVNQRLTLLQFASVKVNKGIPDFTFTQQNLSRD